MISSLVSLAPLASLVLLAVPGAAALNFTIAGGQVFTPGLAVLDAPQPGTPLGGDLIEVALDVSANGRMPLPPYGSDSPSKIFNITIFLSSYDTGKNFTITNGTASANNASLGDIMFQEPGSTVKHVKWKWPSCLVGNGQPTTVDSLRGVYNVSIRQNFRLNGVDHYTIFDLPISVTNEIKEDASRPSCDDLSNPLLSPDQISMNDTEAVGPLFAPGDTTVVQATGTGFDGDGLGPTKPEGTSGGLGNSAGVVRIASGAPFACVVAIFIAMLW